MAEEKVPQKVIMIVNGQPIEVCLKTLILSNKQAQNVLTSLKKQSLQDIHTLRLYWGDVIMLNIITNQLLQKIDSRNLARILKPVNTLEEDLEEYRIEHGKQIVNLKDALIKAQDTSLPLDYSRELEKYYKDEYIDRDKKDENEFKDVVKEINSTIQPNNNEEDKAVSSNNTQNPEKSLKNKKKENSADDKNKPKTNFVDGASKKQKPKTTETPQKRATYKKDSDEEVIDFLSLFGGQIKEEEKSVPDSKPIENFLSLETSKTNKKTDVSDKDDNNEKQSNQTKTEFSAAQEAFTNYNSLDLDKLFD